MYFIPKAATALAVGRFASGAVLTIEELFHTACRGVGDEESSGRFADEGEGVGHVARTEAGVAGFEVVKLVANLDDVFAFEDIEPLVFDGMDVEGRAAFFRVVVLHGEEVAATVFGGDFEGGGSVGDWPLEVITILTGPDGRDVGGGAEELGAAGPGFGGFWRRDSEEVRQ
jgi:hypothetical protein